MIEPTVWGLFFFWLGVVAVGGCVLPPRWWLLTPGRLWQFLYMRQGVCSLSRVTPLQSAKMLECAVSTENLFSRLESILLSPAALYTLDCHFINFYSNLIQCRFPQKTFLCSPIRSNFLSTKLLSQAGSNRHATSFRCHF